MRPFDRRKVVSRKSALHLTILVLAIILFGFDGMAAEEPTPLEPKWKFRVPRWVDSSPALGDDGVLYFGSHDQRFMAVDTNGIRRWSFATGAEVVSSPALTRDERLYFGCRDNHVYALNTSGTKLWSLKTGGWVDSSPALGNDGTIYVGSWDKTFYALRPDGDVKWTFSTGGPILSSPAISANGLVCFGSNDGRLYALSAQGEKAWEFSTSGPVIASPAIGADGTIYFSSLDGNFYALTSSGELRWKLRTGGITDCSPVIATDGTLLLGVNNTAWTVSSEGEKVSSFKMPHPLRSPPVALSGGSHLLVVFQGPLRLVDMNNKLVGTYPLWGEGKSSATVSPAGLLFVVSAHHELMAFPTDHRLAQSSWPKFRGNLRNTGNVADNLP